MPRLARIAFTSLCCLALLGCTSLRSLPASGPAGPPTLALLQPGDEVHLRQHSGAQLELRVTATTPWLLHGVDRRTGAPHVVPAADLAELQRREWDGPKSLALLASALLLLVAYVQAAGVSALAAGL